MFLLVVCCQLPAIANATQINTNLLTRSDGSSISYYLERRETNPETNPETNLETKTLLLVFHGSDCNSVAHIKSVRDGFSNVLPNADLLTIEKYGIDSSLPYSSNPERQDCPKPYLLKDSPDIRANDAVRVLDHLLAKYQYKQIVVLGGSEGALVANLLTSKVNYITASIVFNGGGRWFLDDVLHSVAAQSTSKKEAAESAEGLTGFAQHILSSEPFEMEMSGHGYAWWRSALEVDQQALLEKTSSPVLLIQSRRDEAVSPSAVDEMVQNLIDKGKKTITYLKYSDLNHRLEDQERRSQIADVVVDIKEWLESIID